MLKPGDAAPDFTTTDDSGDVVTLSGLLAAGPLVLYFYPADFTPTCTKQACMMRDEHEGLVRAGVRIVGVNPGSESLHRKFKTIFSLPFPILADRGKHVARAFGVARPFGLIQRRASFLIDADRTILDVARGEFGLGAHREFVARVLERFAGSGGSSITTSSAQA